ncbi:hypothetical protein DY000_02015922 [Brassica cretica]|uniref:Uncharacterized protein n=1 Tax=Brassica cretica TaxID=69181 RepID=A0ABQ7CSY7_BRACR|nr:hypothetical protein DY000_02015922 [Brassica cretica]
MPLGSRPLSKSYYAALCFVQKATVRLLSRAGVTLTLKRVRQLPGLSISAGVNLPGVVMQAPVLLLPMSGGGGDCHRKGGCGWRKTEI